MKYIILLCYIGITFLQAQSIHITDKKNNQILIENPIIYYTSKKSSALNLFYQPDIEKKGIRVKHGMGMVVIPWEKVKKLYFNSVNEDNVSATLEHNATLMPLELIPPTDGLEGETDLGIFLIHFKDIKTLGTK